MFWNLICVPHLLLCFIFVSPLFHFFYVCENISSFFFELCFWRTSFFFVFLRFFSFLLFFILDFLCLYLVNLPFCSLRCSSCFSLSFYSFTFFLSFVFHHFFAFILSTLLLAWFFHGLPFLVRLKKTVPSHFLSPLSQFFSISLFPNCLFFVSSFHLYLFFLFSPFFSLLFSFIFHSCHGILGHRWLWNMCTDFQATECWCKNVPRDFCWTSTSPSLRIESASFNPAISASWCPFRSA